MSQAVITKTEDLAAAGNSLNRGGVRSEHVEEQRQNRLDREDRDAILRDWKQGHDDR